jgi:hypothetical protein
METIVFPLYQSHKQVRAALITGISKTGPTTHITVSYPLDKTATLNLSADDLVNKPIPEVGMYFIEYLDNNYFSFSPASSFKGGYTKVEE